MVHLSLVHMWQLLCSKNLQIQTMILIQKQHVGI